MLVVKRPLQAASTSQGVAISAASMSLIATTYGMARFGVGLLHPAMAVERPGLATALSWASAAQFISYCLTTGGASLLVPRRSRLVAGAAGAVASIGCLGLGLSTSAGWFIVSAFVAGSGAGLASPALVGLLDAMVPGRMASAAQAVVNSGTSVGVIGAGVLAAVIPTPEVAWLLMAALCLATATAVAFLSSGTQIADPSPPVARPQPSLTVPIVSAMTAGFISAATWTYGPSAVVARGALDPDQVGLLWTALGLGGFTGAFINGPVSRWGPARSFSLCAIVLLVTSIAVLTPNLEGRYLPLIGAACFGSAYMAMSGALILWGRRLDPQRGAAITAWLFLAVAIGQAAGAHVLGAFFP
jgi:MFS family permease